LVHVISHCCRAHRLFLIDLFNAERDGRRSDYGESEVVIDDDFFIVSCQLNEPVNVRELVLVDDRVLKQVNVVHCLGKVNKCPTVKTYVFGCLQLVVKH